MTTKINLDKKFSLFVSLAAVGGSTKLGLLVYNRDWAAFSPTEVHRLAEAIPQLIAWKEGQADIRRYQMIMERVGDRLHWIGKRCPWRQGSGHAGRNAGDRIHRHAVCAGRLEARRR